MIKIEKVITYKAKVGEDVFTGSSRDNLKQNIIEYLNDSIIEAKFDLLINFATGNKELMTLKQLLKEWEEYKTEKCECNDSSYVCEYCYNVDAASKMEGRIK